MGTLAKARLKPDGEPGNLRKIPGVGKAIEKDLQSLGIFRIPDLKDKDPELLYHRLCEIQGKRVDRCMLYVFRLAVYFASNSRHDPGLLKWWRWKNGAVAPDNGR